jgi:hypothetical protein
VLVERADRVRHRGGKAEIQCELAPPLAAQPDQRLVEALAAGEGAHRPGAGERPLVAGDDPQRPVRAALAGGEVGELEGRLDLAVVGREQRARA